MSGFTFAKGNLLKLVSSPLYFCGAVASMLVKRNRNLWVFASGSGIGEGPLALYKYAATDRDLHLIWLARSKAELAQAKTLGLNAATRNSWRGFRLTLRAGVIAVSHGLGDANRFGMRGAFVVQMWHGIPLKKIQLDSPVTFSGGVISRQLLKRAYRRSTRSIQLMPAASQLSANRLKSAFGLREGVIAVTGDPRDDAVLSDPATAKLALEQKLGNLGQARIVLFAPTWRDGEADPVVPSQEEWLSISTFLEETNSLLVVRPHPHAVGDYSKGPSVSKRIRMLAPKLQHDVNPILPAVDLLITDYSSIAFDFSLLERPIAFLAPDVVEYAKTRGLYEKYSAFSGGSEVASWHDLLSLLRSKTTLKTLAAHAKQLAKTHQDFRDGKNTARVYEELRKRLTARFGGES